MNYYSERLTEYGDDVRALGWGSLESQRIRFQILAEIGIHDGSVLDVGCGFGDLYQYLWQWEIAEYIGYDTNPDMLAQAKLKYPGARFVDHPVEADYILESGAFNLTEDWHSEVMNLWDSFCRRGMALNFTSSFAEVHTPGIVYADPLETAKFLSTLTKKFVLRHDYRQNDFTCYLYK